MKNQALGIKSRTQRAATMAERVNNRISPTLDPKSPYYLHQGFQPFDFSHTKLSEAEDNYVIWKYRFLNFLRITNKIGFIDGSIEKPDPSSPLFEPWEQCNAMVMCWLYNSMTEGVCNHVVYSETAHKAWEDLRMIFVPCVDLKIYQLRRTLAGLRQGDDSVAKYFGKLRKAWMELSEYDPLPKCSCGNCNCETTKRAEEARDREKRYAFLMCLNKDLDFVRMEIMYTKSPPSLFDAFVMVQQSESMMKRNSR